jgi:uncharacterized protein YjiS (DUF1127 family)
MSYIPMHNRFAEGFVEPYSWGGMIDPLSSRVLPSRFGDEFDASALEREARAARDVAILGALRAGWAALRRGTASLAVALHPLRDRVEAWRERRNAAKELYGLDDRTLAELGLRRSEIPFVIARPVRERDQRPALPRRPVSPGNDNRPRGISPGKNNNRSRSGSDLDISPLYFVK